MITCIFILQAASGDADMANKEMQIIHMEFLAKKTPEITDQILITGLGTLTI